MEGRTIKSCTYLAVAADGREIVTIEGVAQNGDLHPIQKAFWENHGLQCGYCTPGMVLSAVYLLSKNPNPTELEIRRGIAGNVCRCTGYQGIVDSIQAAAEKK
jgi:carbon-monoxide dehydrogenase small subunit